MLTVSGQGVLTITPADIDTAGGETLAAVGATAAAQLREVLRAEREERSITHLLQAGALSVAATLLFLVVFRIVRLARRTALRRIPAVARPRLPNLELRGFQVLTARQALGFVRRLVDLSSWAVVLIAVYVWLAFVLTRFAYSRPWGEALGAYLHATVRSLVFRGVAAIPGLFTVALILVATRWLARVLGNFFDSVRAGRVDQSWVHPETAEATKRIVIVGLWLLAVVVAYPYVPGSGSDVFKGISVFAGVVLSLGSSGVVSQAMSGLVLTYARALRAGDYVRVGEVEGVVTSLGMLSTKIRTPKREVVTLPNAVIVGTTIKNFSRLSAEPGGRHHLHERDDRLRRALATGRGDAADRRRAHGRALERPRAVRAEDGAVGLLR